MSTRSTTLPQRRTASSVTSSVAPSADSIIRDKLFFFGGIQETIVRQDPSGSSAFIPTPAALNGDFSSLDGAGCQSSGVARAIKNPQNGTPLGPTDFINPGLFDPAAVAFMKYIPVSSTNACGQIHYGVPVIYDARQYVTRVDWVINQKNQLYGRYLQDNYDQPAPFSTTNYLYTTTLGVNQRPQTFVLGETFAINPTSFELLSLHLRPQICCSLPQHQGHRSGHPGCRTYLHATARYG